MNQVKRQAIVGMKNIMYLFLQLLHVVLAFGSLGDVVQVDQVLKPSVLLDVLSSPGTQELGQQ